MNPCEHAILTMFLKCSGRKGLKIIADAAYMIDETNAAGRDALLPLLEHEQEGVRTVAAAALWQSHPDRAIPVLQHVDRHGTWTAAIGPTRVAAAIMTSL